MLYLHSCFKLATISQKNLKFKNFKSAVTVEQRTGKCLYKIYHSLPPAEALSAWSDSKAVFYSLEIQQRVRNENV